jgi:hypothetical protein
MQFGVTKSDFVLQNRIPQLPMFKAFLAKRETPQACAKESTSVFPATFEVQMPLTNHESTPKKSIAFVNKLTG